MQSILDLELNHVNPVNHVLGKKPVVCSSHVKRNNYNNIVISHRYKQNYFLKLDFFFKLKIINKSDFLLFNYSCGLVLEIFKLSKPP